MSKRRTFRFTIDGPYKPDTIPMGRLAEYMAEIATILGERANVHFVEVQPSSVAMVSAIEDEAYPKVEQRVVLTRRGEGPPDAVAAYQRTNRMLREDNGVGRLNDETAEILTFPGREEAEPVRFPVFSQGGTLDGVPCVVGGRGDWVPVHLESGPIVRNCVARRDVAKQLARYIFTDEVRVSGIGRWSIADTGDWVLESFRIHDFEVLDQTPLTEVVEALHAIPNNGWEKVSDPWAELKKLRDGPVETH